MSRKNKTNKQQVALSLRPRILVLEALSGGARAVSYAGGQVVERYPRPTERTLDTIENEGWHGLLLTGGADVDPRLYGARPHRSVYGVNEVRDDLELYALEWARERNVPVLGICRGCQIMNVEAGGTLRQHIEGHRGGTHLVYTHPKKLLARAAGQPIMRVVSLHHQAVKLLGEDFEAVGCSRTGTIESIASIDGRCLGVQFHPEMDRTENYARSIFRWLVVEAAKRAKLPLPPEQTYKPATTSYYEEKRKGKHRKAGTRPWNINGAKPKAQPKQQEKLPTRIPGVTTSWMCPQCGIIFDHIDDRDDHVNLLHKKNTKVGAA